MSHGMNQREGPRVRTAPVQDNRRHARMAVSLPCEVRSGQLAYKATIVHLSLSGAFVTSENLPSRGEPLTVSIPSPQGNRTLTLTGRVARTGLQRTGSGNFRGFAVRFEHASPDLVLILKEAIEKRAPFMYNS